MNKNTTHNAIWVYDCETYPNFFCVTFKNPDSQKLKIFTIFEDTNDIDDLYFFINDKKKWLVGYNSFVYDNQLLNYIHKKHCNLTFCNSNEITSNINNLSNVIIQSEFKEYAYNLPFEYLDLMKLGRYKKSLKLLGTSLKWSKLQDLPIPPESIIKKENVETLLSYNLNDVLITEQLYEHLKNSIQLRCDLSNMYKLHLHSESDTSIANRLLEKFYSKITGLPIRAFKNLRTERNFIKFDWVIFKDIDFQTPQLMKMLEDMKSHIYYKAQPFFGKKIRFDNIYYKLGKGGIHSVDKGAIFEETENEYLIDADISGMYSATVINHELKPAHLDNKFLTCFKRIRDRREDVKQLKEFTESEGLKLVLNSAVGKTLNKYSWLYDPFVNLQVTINGQLYLLMLIEQLVLNGFKVISANTDGITTKVDKSKEKEYYNICKKWENQTNYALEYNYYKKYIRRDVNNYIAIKQNNEVKTKGIFIKEFAKKFNNATDPLNKGWDKPIVSIALYEYFINNIPIKNTIESHKDIYNFCIAKKTDTKFTNEYRYIKNRTLHVDILQPSVRYYVSNKGGSLLKTNKKENVIISYESNKNVTIFNNYKKVNKFEEYDINYLHYINSTQKIINEIIKQQLSLF